MKNIHYAGEELMTSDAIADAVVEYAEALARHETSSSIDIPVVTESGDVTEASFLLGPASQLIAVPVDTDFPDPEDADVLEGIRQRRRKLMGVQVEPTPAAELQHPYDDDF